MQRKRVVKSGTHKTGRELTRSTHQTGKTNVACDRPRTAMYPGKRLSKKGKVYWEFRRNRTDVSKTKRL